MPGLRHPLASRDYFEPGWCIAAGIAIAEGRQSGRTTGRHSLVWNLNALQLTPGTYTLPLQIGSASISRIIAKS